MDGTAFLIKKTPTGETDMRGFPLFTESRTEIYVSTAGLSEKAQSAAAKDGFRADLKLISSMWDYDGAQEIEFDGKIFEIYRTYIPKNSESIELYLHDPEGVSNG